MEAGNDLEELFMQNFVGEFEVRAKKLEDLNEEIEYLKEELRGIWLKENCLKDEQRELEDGFCLVNRVKGKESGCWDKFEEGGGVVLVEGKKVEIEKKIEEHLGRIRKFEDALGVRIIIDKNLYTFYFNESEYVCLGLGQDYWVEKVNPNIENIQKIVWELNKTNDLSNFLKTLKLLMKN